MDEPTEITPEEQKAEQDAIADVKDDELRSKIAEEMGIDPEDEAELLDKVFAREKANREKLSGAIKQKISWREKANTSVKKTSKKDGESPEKSTDELVSQKVKDALEARDLEELSYPDDIKAEIKDLAKLRGISVREASKLPYIQSRISEAENKKKLEDAIPTRKKTGGYVPNFDPTKQLNPADFDLSTEEGRKAWNDAKASRREYQEKNK